MVYWYQQSIKSPNSNIKALYWRRCKTESRFYLVPMFFFFEVISHLQKLWAKFHGILLVYLSYTVLAHTQTLCGHQIFSNCKLVQQHTSFNFYYFYLYLFSQKRMMSCNVTLGKLIPFFFFLGNMNREVLEIEFLTTKTSLCFATPSIPAAWDVILLRHEVSPFIFQYFLLWFVVYICVVHFAKVFWFGSWLVFLFVFFFVR